jgi:hypothetical protein
MLKATRDKKAGSPIFSTSTSICRVGCSPRMNSSLKCRTQLPKVHHNLILIFIVSVLKKNGLKRDAGTQILQTRKF